MGRMKGLGFTTGTVPSVLTRTFWIFLVSRGNAASVSDLHQDPPVYEFKIQKDP